MQAAHQTHHGGEYPGFDAGEGLLAKQGAEAGVAGFIFLPGEAAELTLQPDGGAADQRYPVLVRLLVEQVANGQVVSAIQDQLVSGQQGIEQRLIGHGRVGLYLKPGVEGAQGLRCGVHLVVTDALIGVQHLPLQVGELHFVEIDQSKLADSGHCQILAGGAAKTASADH